MLLPVAIVSLCGVGASILYLNRQLHRRRVLEHEAFQQISDTCLVLLSRNGRVLSMNREAERFFENQKGEESEGSTSPISGCPDLVEELRRVNAEGPRNAWLVSNFCDGRGEEITVTARIAPLTGGKARWIGYLLSFRPVETEEGLSISFSLSGRETEVLRHLIGGATSRETAVSLGISERTVKSHVTHIYQKLGVNSRMEAARLLQTRGYLPDDA
jgi:DNA-binding CsgD family transcriptional regulator